MNRKIFKLALILLLAFGLSSTTFAQGRLTGSISGIVVDDQENAIPGVKVNLSGPALMGTQSFITTKMGNFRFLALLPGEYEIKAEMSGFNPFIQKGLYCSVGKIAECKITLTPTALKTEITVVAVSPTIDVQSTKMAVNYGKDFLLALPNARDLYGIQDSIPGSIRAEDNREYTRMSSILGSTIRSTLYQLDGAVMNDPTTTYVAANINVDVYDEVEISIGALPAEVGQTETALINIVSKSGGNKFSGMISGYYTGMGDKKSIKFLPDLSESLWTDEQIAALKVNPPGTYADYKDGSVGLGGPIIKDKLWFYFNGRALSQVTLLPFTPENRMAVLAAAKPGQIDPRDLVHYDMEHQEAMVFSKLTFALTKNIRYSGRPDQNAKNSTGSEKEITVASWNLKNFGLAKLNDPARINVIIGVLEKYDIIAIQEVEDAGLTLPALLIGKINSDGKNYNVVSSNRLGRDGKEQYLFVYNDDVIDFIPDTTGYGIEPKDEFAREPFYAMFRAGNFDFYLMTIHTDPDDVSVEIPALKNAYVDLQDKTPNENDIVLLGDLNAKAPGVTAGSYISMDAIATIPNIVFTIKEETNTRGGKAYDNIIFQGNYTAEYSNSCGVYKFWVDYGLTEDDGFKISDHRPVWAKFRTDLKDDD